jgi:phenylacetate-CoA ligase
VVLNTFSYHLTPGGFIFDTSARSLGCAVIPSGPGNTEAQFQLIEAYRPIGYSGTPDFLKMLLDAADKAGRHVSSIRRALVSRTAFPPSLQSQIKGRGIDACQAFGTANLGIVAFATPARDGMVVNEDLILEIVKPGTGDPVADGGEIVVTSPDPRHPWIRRAWGPHCGTAGNKRRRAHQHAHRRLDEPRRLDHQGQGHVRAARTDRGGRCLAGARITS